MSAAPNHAAYTRADVDDAKRGYPTGDLTSYAAARGLEPVLHRRYPRLPMPGTSMGVLVGTLPGTTRLGRLTWQTQAHPESSLYFRPGAIMTAADNAPSMPVGGMLVKSTEMYVITGDGLPCCWTQASSTAKLNAAETATCAVETFRATGVADV